MVPVKGYVQDCLGVSNGYLGAQIHSQLKLVPEVLHGYTYSIGSLAAAALLGVLVYGSIVWSA
jgi:hypothetical protein